MHEKTFEQVFIERLNSVEARAKKLGMTITHVCRESGVARATPDRWRANTPNTITLIDKMEAVVAAHEKAA